MKTYKTKLIPDRAFSKYQIYRGDWFKGCLNDKDLTIKIGYILNIVRYGSKDFSLEVMTN